MITSRCTKKLEKDILKSQNFSIKIINCTKLTSKLEKRLARCFNVLTVAIATAEKNVKSRYVVLHRCNDQVQRIFETSRLCDILYLGNLKMNMTSP